MIVEDNMKMRRMMKEIFSTVFNIIIECTNGVDAIKKYNEVKPDWTFMDIKMEGMNGIEATREIIKKDSSARIIIVTNYNDNGLIASAKNAGAMEYVLKDNLLSIIDIVKARN